MGFLHWVFGKHPVKPPRPPDPDKVAIAGRVAPWQAPMIISLLAERGIRATTAEVTLPDRGSRTSLTTWPHAIVYVMEPDHEAASAFITSFLSPEFDDDELNDIEEFDDDFDQ